MPTYLVPEDKTYRPVLMDRAILFFGRHPDCDVIITCSRKVSRKHCCVAQIDDYFVVRDLGSMNGVTVNGSPSGRELKLKVGDRVLVGDVPFDVVSGHFELPKGKLVIGPSPERERRRKQAGAKRKSKRPVPPPVPPSPRRDESPDEWATVGADPDDDWVDLDASIDEPAGSAADPLDSFLNATPNGHDLERTESPDAGEPVGVDDAVFDAFTVRENDPPPPQSMEILLDESDVVGPDAFEEDSPIERPVTALPIAEDDDEPLILADDFEIVEESSGEGRPKPPPRRR